MWVLRESMAFCIAMVSSVTPSPLAPKLSTTSTMCGIPKWLASAGSGGLSAVTAVAPPRAAQITRLKLSGPIKYKGPPGVNHPPKGLCVVSFQ